MAGRSDFLVRMSTDDEQCTKLFGEPMTPEGLAVAIQAAFGSYGAVVDAITHDGKEYTPGTDEADPIAERGLA